MAAQADTQKDKNLALAVLGIAATYKYLPLGGLNRGDAIASMGHLMFLSQLILFNELRNSYEKNSQHIISTIILSGELKAAFCGEMAQYALHFIKEAVSKIDEKILVEIVELKNHQMVVIGRDPNSNPEDIETWGENSVICDPWARKFYETSKFKLEKSIGEKIKIIQCINPSTGEILKTQDDYLEGSPRIRF